MNLMKKLRTKGIRQILRSINDRMIWFYRQKISNGTSTSDDGIYNRIVMNAVRDDEKFKVFRSNRVYCQIVECPGEEEGKRYIDVLNDVWPRWRDYSDEIARNDSIGGPKVFFYSAPFNIKCSPYTIQKMMEIGCMLELCPYLQSENAGGGVLLKLA